MEKRKRYIIKDSERGHRPKLIPEESTVRVTLQFPESLWEAIKKESHGKHQNWIRSILTNAVNKGSILCILILLSLSLSLWAGERYDEFTYALTKGDNTRYADTNLFLDNARFYVAAEFYNKKLGDVRGSIEKDKKLFILFKNDTIPTEKFQKNLFEKDSLLLAEYTKESLDLIKTYHNWIIALLYIRNKCVGENIYLERSKSMAINLDVLKEYLVLEPTLIEFMQEMCAECRKNPADCKK
jgi:hypothetical protein